MSLSTPGYSALWGELVLCIILRHTFLQLLLYAAED